MSDAYKILIKLLRGFKVTFETPFLIPKTLVKVNTDTKKIAIQGIEGSFHHGAALQMWGGDIQVIGADNFMQLIEMVASGKGAAMLLV